MFSALAFISLRQWQQHKLRLILTLLGIALGVAVFFAVITSNTTLISSLQTTVEKLAGKATLQITAGETGFSEEYLEITKDTPGVKIAEPIVEVIAKTSTDENLLVLGIDTASGLELHSGIVASQNISISNPLRFVNRTDSIAISRSFAERKNLKEGDSLELFTNKGKKKFIVRGFFSPKGAGEIFGGNVAVLDIYNAQEVFERGNMFDRIDIMTNKAHSVNAVKKSLQAKLPDGVNVMRPINRGQKLEKAISSVRMGMSITSFTALTIGIFIIFNSFYISVNQRRKEIGILRALGVERKQAQMMFLNEAVLFGFVGSILGVGLGYALSIGATKVITAISASNYGLVTTTQIPELKIEYVIASIIIGIIASLIAAWIPSRIASKLSPISALRHVETFRKESEIGLLRIILGIGLVFLGIGLIWLANPAVGFFIQLTYWGFILLGMVILLPKFVSIGALILRPLMNRIFGVEGLIAVDTMARSPKRTSATVGALMIGLAFVFGSGALISSQKAALLRTLDRAVNVDYFVTTSEQIRSRVYHFSEETASRVAKIDGIKQAESLRVTSIDFRGDEIALLAHDMEGWITRAPNVLNKGNAVKVKEKMAGGKGFFVSENFALRFGFKMGDTVTLKSPSGNVSRKILGVLEYYQSENGSIFLDRQLYKKFWNDSSLDYILITLKPNIDRAGFKPLIEKAIAGEQKAFIYSQMEYQNWVMRLIDQFFTMNYLQMIIAIFVAGLGLINTMIISVSERKREIGIIRAIGGLRSQIRKMILLESVCIAIIGVFVGIIAGILNAYNTINVSVVVITGFSLPFRFPYVLVAISLPIVIIASLLSAWLPAKLASRLEIAEAIEYE